MTRAGVRVGCGLAILLVLALSRAAAGWGPEGHAIVTRAALAASDGLPPWFRDAGDADPQMVREQARGGRRPGRDPRRAGGCPCVARRAGSRAGAPRRFAGAGAAALPARAREPARRPARPGARAARRRRHAACP